MSLEPALVKAWDAISEAKLFTNAYVRFLADEFVVDVKEKKVLTPSCKIPEEGCLTVLILHYLAQKMTGLPAPTGEWLSLEGLSVAVGFADVFGKRATDLILKKYGSDPNGIYHILEKIPGKNTNHADASIVLEAFEGVPILIELWRSDDEFGPQGNLLFDKSITQIFCTEDILVLAEVVAGTI